MGRCREDCEAGIGDILWIQQLVSFVSYSDRLSDVHSIFACGFGIRVLHDEFCSSYISGTDSVEGDPGSDQLSSGDLRDGFDESLASAVDGKGLEISDSGITGDGDDLSLSGLDHAGNDSSHAVGGSLAVDIDGLFPLVHHDVLHVGKVHDT